ncbi:hypothetical protein GCM10022232_51500 [Streptomyces plumbiresistens]|uniref:Transposase n=1 Tax=Streptomyces plumbiresistens TaxID=511811 RepID=A0ABP7S2D4_9ACTN
MTCPPPSRVTAPGTPRHSPRAAYPANLFPEPANSHEQRRKTGDQPPVTPRELGLYMRITLSAVPFCQVRSHWGSRVTADTENNPLIGLPNQHIVGLTYVP